MLLLYLKKNFHNTTTTYLYENLLKRLGTDNLKELTILIKTKAFKNFLMKLQNIPCKVVLGDLKLEAYRKKQTRFYQTDQTSLFGYQKVPFIHPFTYLSIHPSIYIHLIIKNYSYQRLKCFFDVYIYLLHKYSIGCIQKLRFLP